MLFSSTIPAFAAMPIDTVIVGNKAYDFEYFQNNAEAILDVQAALDAGENVYVKFDGGMLNVVINEFLENSEELPEVEYYDKDGNVTRYEAGDGDPVESEFKVIEISAIEDITVEFGGELVLPKTVKATLDNEEATEVTLAIEWAENEEFDAEVAGDYTFTGTLSKVEGEEVEFTIPEDKATVTVKVTVEEEVVEALRVESVSAINNQVIPAGEATALKFLVNGTEELTAAEFDEKYGEEGYEVAFKFNFTPGFADGVVNKTAGTYKYAVEVTDADENVIPEGGVVAADFVEFKVVEATEATLVNSIALYDGAGGNDGTNEEWTADTVAVGDIVTIDAKVWENALGETSEDDENIVKPGIATITSSDPTVAYYDNGIQILKAGTVTFTVKFVDIEETVDITVDVKLAQEVAGVEADAKTARVATGANVKFTLLDKDGEAMRTATTVYYTATLADGIEGAATSKASDAKGVTTITAEAEAGVYTVNVYKEAAKENKLGSFTYEAVAVAGEEIDEFEIVKAENVKFEITVGEGGDITKTPANVTIDGYIDGVKVNADAVKAALADVGTDVVYTVESSDEDVATADFAEGDRSQITVTPVAAGTTTIKTVKTEGDFVTVLATLDITVDTKVPQVTNLTLKDDAEFVEATFDAEKAITFDYSNLTAGKNADNAEIFKDYMVKTATPIELVETEVEGAVTKITGRVIIEIKADFGGGTYFFDFEAEATPAEGVEVDPTVLTLRVGDTGNIRATVSPANATYKDVTWKSSDKEVAAVDENGEVTAVAAGEAIITATTVAGGKTASTTVIIGDLLVEEGDSIQAAIDTADTGDTILVAAGTYDEIVGIKDKSITIIGGDKEETKIKAISAYPGTDNNLTVKNLTIYGNNGSGQSYAGIFISNGNVIIEGCILTPAKESDNTKRSIETQYNNSANITIKDCDISGYESSYFNPTTGKLVLQNNNFNNEGPSIDSFEKTTITGNTNMTIGLFIGYELLDVEFEDVLNGIETDIIELAIALHNDNPGAVVKLSTTSTGSPATWGGFLTAVEDGELVIIDRY
jgi:hypothetical protein